MKSCARYFLLALCLAGPALLAQQRNPDRSIAGSTMTLDSIVPSGPHFVLNFTVTRVSPDTTWLNGITIRMNAPWEVLSLTSVPSAGATSGVGTPTARFTHATNMCNEYGWGGTATISVTLTIDAHGDLNPQTLTYMLQGDDWGADPQIVCSPTDPCNDYDACYGAQTPNIAPTDLTTFAPLPVELMQVEVD